MKKNLLIITQKVDEGDDLLGFFVAWISELAKYFERVDVIALGVGKYALPGHVHVHSLGKENGSPKVARWLRYIRFLWRYTPNRGSVFAHMSPLFAISVWPCVAARGSRLVLWYLHRSRTLKLRLAATLCDAIATADAESLTLRHRKVVATGHGIDIRRFAVARDWSAAHQRPLRIVSVSRLSPIKDLETLIRAAAILREHEVPVDVRIVGRAVMPDDHAYERHLHDLVARLGVSDTIHFWGFVPYRDIAPLYAWADIAVGCTPKGGIDKSLLEAMAAGCVVFTSNAVMRTYFGASADALIFEHSDARELALRIQSLTDLSSVSEGMRASVRAHHDLVRTVEKIATLL